MIMTKRAYPTAFFASRSDLGPDSMLAHARLSEPELSAWAEQSTIAANEGSRFGRVGTLAFWTVVAGLLIVRFFVIDPAKLRPEASSSSVSVSSVTPSKI